MNKRPLIILAGPTAVGKTSTSIELAKAVNGEIISADSMQVYQYMDIGTAKISVEEMDGIKHYLIDAFKPDDEFSVAVFKECAMKCMDEIYGKGKIPILVGGTGFYIQAILFDIQFCNIEGHKYREEIELFYREHGGEALHNRLKEVDPQSALNIHTNNVKRVMRALEYFSETGEKFSSHNDVQKQRESKFNHCYFVLNDQRDLLYQRIEERIDLMMEQGLVKEVQSLLDMGYDRDLVSMQGLGYKEIISYLYEEITLEEAIYVLKRDTRRFAKRQLTWFRKEDVVWIDKGRFNYQLEEILSFMMDELHKKEIL